MIKHLQRTACALAMLSTTASMALAANSINIEVAGVIKPAACTPTLGDGGVVDYGNIGMNTLSVDHYTVLDEKELNVSVTCDALAKIALKLVNNQPADNAAGAGAAQTSGFALKPAEVTFKSKNSYVAGLGLAGPTKIGGYNAYLDLTSFTSSDGANDLKRDIIFRDASKPTVWNKSTNGNLMNSYVEHLTVAKTGTLVPEAFKTMTGKMKVQAYISRTSDLDLSQEIKLDGKSTIELVYL